MTASRPGIIFDMDGTLVDTMRMTAVAMNAACPRLGLPVPPMEAVRALIGFSNEPFYRALYPDVPAEIRKQLSDDVEILEAQAAQTLGEQVLFLGVLSMLKALYDEGIPMYIASTGTPYHVGTSLAACGCTGFFRAIHCGEPDKADMTARILASAGAIAAFIGDSIKDVQAARTNDLIVLGAGFGYVKPDERPLFDLVLDTPDALLEHLLKA